ncbi:hypothetical protein GCM10020369_82210 [Cryptosporangium minutisporangium]|uniref:Uncharacterized protein n=1 Tax=Cryptosporangium minutisporangium TaxID=113569 RepID=A0ABP6TBS4_9ACTN
MALLLGVGFALLPGGQAALAAPQAVCTVNDNRLPEISGLVAVDDGYAVITDSDDTVEQVSIYLLDAKCAVTDTLTSDVDPFDPEDLARTSDGAYWVADIGDSDSAPERETIAVHLFPASGTPTIQRMRYPDGAKNAEALLVQNNNVPVVVTKTPTGSAKVYKASQPISGPSKSAEQAVPLTLVGTAALGAGELVTGGALSPDGKRVALRTYTSIYEWDVADGDAAKALTSGKPRKTLLTGQQGQQGEAVTYAPDGKSFLTIPEGTKANPASALQRWATANQAQATQAAGDTGSGADTDSDGGFLSSISFSQITTLVAVVGLIGLGLLVAGIVGIVRFRKRAQDPAIDGPPRGPRVGAGPRIGNGPGGRPGEPDFEEPVPAAETMQLPRVAGAVYGGRPDGGRPDGARGGAAVPPSPRGAARPVGAGPDGGFRSEGPGAGAAPVAGAASVSGPAAGAASVTGAASVAGAAPVSGPSGRGTVYGSSPSGGSGGFDPETTGSGRVRRPQGPPPPARPGPGDPTTTGGGRVRRAAVPPRGAVDPETTGSGRVREPGGPPRPAAGGGSRGSARPGAAPPPPPVDRSAPTRARRAGPPPMPPGTTYGGGRDGDGRGGRDGRDTDGRGWDSRTGDNRTGDVRGGRGGRDPDWETTGSGRARPPGGDRMRPPPPPGERPAGGGDRGRRDGARHDDDGRPPPGGRRPPPPPDRPRYDG